MADYVIGYNTFVYTSNNPVLNIDSNGYDARTAYAVSSVIYANMIAMSAAATSLIASIKAFIVMIWNIVVVVGLLLVVIASIVYICKTVTTIYDAITKGLDQDRDEYKKYKDKICVYVLTRKEQDMSSIFYVGRTKNTVARSNAHKSVKGEFCMYVIYVCSSILQSRVVEQCVLAACLTGQYTNIVFGQEPSNKINGINLKKARNVINALSGEIDDTISLLGCTPESDLLLLMEH